MLSETKGKRIIIHILRRDKNYAELILNRGKDTPSETKGKSFNYSSMGLLQDLALHFLAVKRLPAVKDKQ